MTAGQVIEIGPFNFTILRLVIAVGFLRIILKGESLSGGMNSLDRLMIIWACWAVFSSVFHSPFAAELVAHLGFVYNCFGVYWLMRVFIQDVDDFLLTAKTLLLLLVPLAAAMIVEKATGKNLFAWLGGLAEISEIREGRVRARGPFGHPILAGTAGAVCLPLAIFFWNRNRLLAVAGIAATAGIIVATASSGPLLTAACTLGALAMYKIRHHMRSIRWAAILLIVVLQFVMKDPVYYLMARVDLVGGRTGWHRARLIEAAMSHLDEWWLGGTDYTRHWMPTGIPANEAHTDITNYYIMMGIVGGLPLLILLVWILLTAFSAVGRMMRSLQDEPDQQVLVWTLGAILFGHAVTFMSIPYFDQTLVFLYLLLASIASIQMQHASQEAESAESETWAPAEHEVGPNYSQHSSLIQ